MRIDPRSLWRHIWTDAHEPTRYPISDDHDLIGQVLANTACKAIQIFNHRGHDEAKIRLAEQIQTLATTVFDRPRLIWEAFLHTVGQYPAGSRHIPSLETSKEAASLPTLTARRIWQSEFNKIRERAEIVVVETMVCLITHLGFRVMRNANS